MAEEASIKAYFGGDTTQLQAAITAAHAMTGKFAKDSAKVFEDIFAAEQSLSAFRQTADMQRSAAFNKDIILQREIIALKQQIDGIQGQTLQKIQLQLQLDQKILQLESSIAAQAAKRSALNSSVGDSGISETARQAREADGVFVRLTKTMFGLRAAVKGIFAGLGIQSVSAIADKLIDRFRKAADAANELAEASGVLADKSIENSRRMLSEEKLLALALTERDRIQRRIDANVAQTTQQQIALKRDQIELESKTAQIIEIRASIEKKSYEESERMFKLIRGAKEEFHEAEIKRAKDLADAVNDGLEKSSALNRKLFDQKIESLSPEQKLIELTKERNELLQVQQLAIMGSNDYKELQYEIGERNAQIEQAQLEIAQERLEAEKRIAEEQKNQKDALLAIAGIRTGTQFNEASDESLAEVVRRNRNSANLSRADASNSGIARDMEIARLELEAANAEKELRFRSDFRKTLKRGGVEAARRSFEGDPLQFDRILQQLTTGLTVGDKQLSELEKLRRAVEGKFVNQ